MTSTPRPPITAERLWDLPRVGAPRGRRLSSTQPGPVTFGVQRASEAEPSGQTQLYRLEESTSLGAVPISAPESSAGESSVSPDGAQLAFTRKKDDQNQIWLLPLNGGEAEVVTDLPFGARDPVWDPLGQGIFFVSEVYRDAPTIDATRAKKEVLDSQPSPRPHVTEDRLYRFWDRWLTDDCVTHIFYWDAEQRTVRDLIPTSRGWFQLMDPSGEFDISPEGREITFSAQVHEKPYDRVQWGLFRVALQRAPGAPVSGGAIDRLDPEHRGDQHRPRYAPAGGSLVYGRQERWDFYADRVRLIQRDGTGNLTPLAPDWDRSPSDWSYSPDGSRLYCLAEDQGRTALYEFDLKRPTEEPRQILRGGTLRGLAWDETSQLYSCHDDLGRAPEIARLDLDRGRIERRTRFTESVLGTVELGASEEVQFEGARGEPVQMFLVYPPNYDPTQRHPVVHLIHGGPHGIFGDQFHFRWNAHVFAAEGWIVAMVNFHGSTSFGQEFAESIHGQWGDLPQKDFQAATDALCQRPDVDPDRICIAGGSYGGYLTAWLTTQTDRFRSAVCHAGVVDFGTMFGGDITQGWSRALGGVPWGETKDALSRFDPIRHLENAVTPMLILHGEKDYRVPVGQGLELYGLLQEKGVETRLVYYPDENHWILKRHNSLHWYHEVLGWIRKHNK